MSVWPFSKGCFCAPITRSSPSAGVWQPSYFMRVKDRDRVPNGCTNSSSHRRHDWRYSQRSTNSTSTLERCSRAWMASPSRFAPVFRSKIVWVVAGGFIDDRSGTLGEGSLEQEHPSRRRGQGFLAWTRCRDPLKCSALAKRLRHALGDSTMPPPSLGLASPTGLPARDNQIRPFSEWRVIRPKRPTAAGRTSILIAAGSTSGGNRCSLAIGES